MTLTYVCFWGTLPAKSLQKNPNFTSTTVGVFTSTTVGVFGVFWSSCMVAHKFTFVSSTHAKIFIFF
jgi:hypothetical protein